jgi:hypothetical protein
MGELFILATGHPLLALALLLTAVCGVLRGWITHRTAIRHEAEATRRVQLAVGGTSSTERAAVVRACAELEAASHLGASVPQPAQCELLSAQLSGSPLVGCFALTSGSRIRSRDWASGNADVGLIDRTGDVAREGNKEAEK